MRKSLLTILTIMLSFSIDVYSQDFSVSDERASEITERLQTNTNDELLERRELLISQLQEEEDGDAPEPTSRSELLFELSIVEQLLILAGFVMLDNVTEDSSVPSDPVDVDTTPPVITVLGDNPVTIELGDTYTDAGATADGGEAVTTDLGGLDINVAGSYTITYSATDAAGNTGTATRTVNVVDTVAPVFTSASTFTIDE